MKTIHQDINVLFSYSVHFTEHLFEPANRLLIETALPPEGQERARILVVLDDGLLKHHPDIVESFRRYGASYSEHLQFAPKPVILPGGEKCKNDERYLQSVYEAINEAALCRHSYIMAVGGGAVLDVAGYAAATAHRSIRLIRVPTTVLAQNDSGVGVKNGINAFGKKNFIGSFHPPFAVLNDFRFLHTLDDRDWRGGISEAFKVALIKNADFFNTLEEIGPALAAREMEPMKELIYTCAALHLDHISTSGDPFEMGTSRPLDFGHWSAHKLEQMTGYELRHGEAVGIGIALDCVYSNLAGLLPDRDLTRILAAFETCGISTYVHELSAEAHLSETAGSLFDGLTEFREHLGGRLTITLIEGIGRGTEVHEVDQDLYRKAVAILYDRVSAQTSIVQLTG